MQGKILGVHHAQITVPKGAESDARRFYVELLGLREVPKPDVLKVRGGFWLQLGNAQVHVGVEDPHVPSSKAHVAYEVDDLAAWRRKLESAGVACKDGEQIPGHIRFEIRDPFGNRVEFIRRLDTAGRRG